MNRNQRIVVSIVGIIIVTLALIGITYAYFMTKIIGNSTSTSISGTLANLELTYDDGNGLIATSEMMPGDILEKTFSVQNTGSVKVENYAVIFENLTNTLTRKGDLVYTLTCTSSDSNPCNGVVNAIFPSTSGPIILNSIEKDVTHSYTLTVTYKNLDNIDQSNDMGKKFEAKVNINDGKNVSYFNIPYTLAYNVINNAKNGTNETSYSKNPITVPGSEANNEDEKVLSEKEDDYGTSYYYRGNVTDNYLSFANMCWRIVRIEGDGSTKIILEDSARPCSSNSGGNFSIGEGKYGYYNDKPDYANGDSSSMRKQFQSWYRSSGLSYYESKLKNDKWLTGDTGVIYGYGYKKQFSSLTELRNEVRDSAWGRYETSKRLNNLEAPILKTTPNEVYVFDYVGTLTATEVALAGGYTTGELKKTTNYLYIDGDSWWTLTISGITEYPQYYSYWHSAFAFPSSTWGTNTIDPQDARSDMKFRPAVVLKPCVSISGQGTKSNPYVVN